MKLRLSAAAMLLALVFLSSSSGRAATLHLRPDGTGDYPTIREAVLAAAPGDSVMLDNGYYRGADNHNIDFGGKPLTVLSVSGDPALCIIDCWMEDPVEERGFHFQTGEDAGSVVDGIGIINGYAHGSYCNTVGAAVLCQGGSSPTIRNCAFKINDASTGGAVASTNSSPVFYNCLIRSNLSTWSGGGAYVSGGHPQFIQCRFLENTTGYDGGAVVIVSGEPEFRDCVFEANAGSNFGGAVYVDTGNPVFRGCMFRNHVAAYQGGVLFSEDGADPLIDTCTFTGNSAFWGGVSWVRGHQTFSRCTMVGNGSEYLSLIRLEDGGSVSIDHTVIAFSSRGSAVACAGYSTATVRCSDIYANPQGDWRWCIESQYDGFNNISVDPAFCSPEEGDFHLLPDSPLLDIPCGRIGAWGPGCESASVPALPSAPGTFSVRVSPNPASGDCRIVWNAVQERSVSLEVFDVAGHRVRSIRALPPGLTAASWNGRNDAGQPVGSGIYLVRVTDRDAPGKVLGTARVVRTR